MQEKEAWACQGNFFYIIMGLRPKPHALRRAPLAGPRPANSGTTDYGAAAPNPPEKNIVSGTNSGGRKPCRRRLLPRDQLFYRGT